MGQRRTKVEVLNEINFQSRVQDCCLHREDRSSGR